MKIVFLLVGVLGEVVKIESEADFLQFQKRLDDAVETIEVSRNGTSRTFLQDKITTVLSSFLVKAEKELACQACQLGIKASHTIAQWEWTRAPFLEVVNQLCHFAVGKPPSVCRGISHSSGNATYDIIRDIDVDLDVVPFMACYAIVNLCQMPQINLKPLPLPAKSSRARIQGGLGMVKVMQISDLHFDREYFEGAEADCNKPICCQKDSNSDIDDKTIKSPASHWGEYTCDASEAIVNSLLKHAAQSEYDMILFTGDIPAHDMWKEQRSRSLWTEREAFSLIHNYFPGKRIYPAIGNHESVPLNQFPFLSEDGKEFYLYQFMASQWKQWLDLPQLGMVRRVGYYSINHSHSLKVIVLNNNLFYIYNYHALLRPTNNDPNGMLAWLIQELHQVEEAGGWAYLVSHIPPGSTDFYHHWSEAYHRIIMRYAHVISAQFYGHLHTDEFEIFYNHTTKSDATAISTAYLAPSVSTLDGINPSYRVYSVDTTTYQIIDYVQYYADLKKKHEWTTTPNWQVMYSARAAYFHQYNPPTLDPKFWHLATIQMETDSEQFAIYQHFCKGKGLVNASTDDAYRQRIVCTLRAAKSKDNCAQVVASPNKYPHCLLN